MEDFASLLERDYGLKPQGKMAPMSDLRQPPYSTRPAPAGTLRQAKDYRSSAPVGAGDGDPFGETGKSSSFSGNGNPFRVHDSQKSTFAPSSTLTFEDIFSSASSNSIPSVKVRSSYPVFDSPVYDDDIFGGLPGIRSAGSAFDDVFTIGSTVADSSTTEPASFDDLLGDFGGSTAKGENINDLAAAGEPAFDPLLPEFGMAEPANPQLSEGGKTSQYNSSELINAFSSNIQKNPFVDLNPDYNPHADYSTSLKHSESKPKDSDMLNEAYEGRQSSTNSIGIENSVSSQVSDSSPAAESFEPNESKSSPSQTSSGAASEKGDSNDMLHATGLFGDDILTEEHKQDIPSRVKDDSSMQRSSSAGSPSQNMGTQSEETYDLFESSAAFREQGRSPSKDRGRVPLQAPNLRKSGRIDECWLSIDDVKLVTKPSTESPPVRPPPVPVSRQGHAPGKFSSKRMPVKDGAPFSAGASFKGGLKSDKLTLDDNEAFVSGSSRRLDAHGQDIGFRAFSPGKEEQGSAAATASGAAVREAIENAEAKLRQAKEAKDKDIDETQGTRNKENGLAHVRDEQAEKKALHDKEASGVRRSEREIGNKPRKEMESQERAKEKERRRGRERELEQGNERANEIALQRAAVEKANAEVREREAQKAAKRAIEAQRKAERAAVERANEEARERYERAAAEKARAERLAALEREKSDKDRMSAFREQQTENEDDLESFFRSTSRPTSAPKQRTPATDGIPSNQELWRGTKSSSTFKKVQSVPSMAENLTSLFGGPSSGADTFQEVHGETAERRKIRWDRYQRTLERAAKALEEKHQRDLRIAKDQEDRQRASELVDAEIKRWAAGKEGNLRALLSTLQYVLWPECGWQPVSLTDLITASAVKKVYKKATLYVHPDKVQQKGATNQQKYIAEKVFDLLQGALTKFNSEELF